MFTKDYEMKVDFSSQRDTPAVLRAVQRAEVVSAPSVGDGNSISYFVGVTH